MTRRSTTSRTASVSGFAIAIGPGKAGAASEGPKAWLTWISRWLSLISAVGAVAVGAIAVVVVVAMVVVVEPQIAPSIFKTPTASVFSAGA
jgi:hypothetical protein